jgi:hypothetical protein
VVLGLAPVLREGLKGDVGVARIDVGAVIERRLGLGVEGAGALLGIDAVAPLSCYNFLYSFKGAPPARRA